MRSLKENQLDSIKGGDATITGTIINALVSVIEVLKNAGYSLGSGVRRISEDNLCPLK